MALGLRELTWGARVLNKTGQTVTSASDGLLAAAKETGNLMLVVEDHYAEGGMGEAVAAAVAPEAVRVEHLAVPCVARSGKPHEVMAWAGIDAAAIVKCVKAVL